MLLIVIVLTLMHFIASLSLYFRNPTNQDKELVIQHHEKCVMLGLLAIAVLWR